MQQNLQNRQGGGTRSDPVMDAASQAGHEAMKVAEQARQQGVSLLARQKDQASEALKATGKAVEEVGHRLQEEGQGTLGEMASMAAQQVEHFSEFLNTRDVEDLFHDLTTIARRQPAYFLGGAFVLGFLGARFLKSSAQSGQMGSWSGQQSWGGGRQQWQGSGSWDRSRGSSGRSEWTPQQRWSEEGQSRAGTFLDDANEPTGSFESPRSWQDEHRTETRTPATSGSSTQERHGRLDPPQSNGRTHPDSH